MAKPTKRKLAAPFVDEDIFHSPTVTLGPPPQRVSNAIAEGELIAPLGEVDQASPIKAVKSPRISAEMLGTEGPDRLEATAVYKSVPILQMSRLRIVRSNGGSQRTLMVIVTRPARCWSNAKVRRSE